MIIQDMEIKREKAISKVWNAINNHNGQTILSTGITGDDARLAKAVVDVGIQLLEPNHPAVALSRGHRGVTTMNDAENIRHEITLEEMLETIKGVRNVIGDEPFITAAVPGTFTEVKPIILSDEDIREISVAGADSLHTHKCHLEDLKSIVEKAHKYGLLVDSYIAHPDDEQKNGIPARTSEEVAKVAKKMEEIGGDMIGLMTGMTYKGLGAGEISNETKERLDALVSTVSVPTLAEGGINQENYRIFRDTGVHVLVIGTSIDQVVQEAAQDIVTKFVS